MKTLIGSEKQIKWAEKIRENFLKDNFSDKLLRTLSFFKDEHNDEDGTLHLGHFQKELFFINEYGTEELNVKKLEENIPEIIIKLKEIEENESATFWINNRDNILLKEWL